MLYAASLKLESTKHRPALITRHAAGLRGEVDVERSEDLTLLFERTGVKHACHARLAAVSK